MSINHKSFKPASLKSACTTCIEKIQKNLSSDGSLGSGPPVRKFWILFAILLAATTVLGIGSSIYNAQFRYDPAIHYQVELTTDNMTPENLNKAKPVLDKRLTTFAGAGNYKIDYTDSDMTLTVPKSAFHGQNITSTVEMLLTGPAKLYLVNVNPENPSEFNKIKLKDSDIEELSIAHGRIKGINPIDYDIEDSEYDYLKITIKSSVIDNADYELSGDWEDNYYLAQDLGNDISSSYNFKLYDAKENGSYKLMIASGSSNLLNTAIQNWTGSHIPAGINVVENYEQNAHWERVSEIPDAGKLQKSHAALTGEDLITVAFRTTASDYAPGEVYDIESEYKARFDAIGQPYAFGTYERFGRTYMVFKTSASRMGKPIYKMLQACDNIDICAGPACATIGISNASASVTKSPDGSSKFRVRTSYDTDVQKITNLKEFASTYGEKEYLLSLGQGYIMSGSTKNLPQDSSIEFETLYNTKSTKMTSGNSWILDLLDTIINSETTMRPMEFVGDSSNIDNIAPGIADFDTNLYADKIKKIHDAGNVKAISTDGQYMEIVLDIKSGKDMPEKFAKQVRSIMKTLAFDKTSLKCVSIYPEIPGKNEKTGVEIYKNIYTCHDSLYSLWGNKYSVDVYASGDYEEYSYEIRSLIDEYRYEELSDRY